MNAKLTPTFKHGDGSCLYLGEVIVNSVKADTFVCKMEVIARFSDEPGDFVLEHLMKLSMTSNIYLLTAFRLYLDKRGVTREEAPLRGGLESPPLQS